MIGKTLGSLRWFSHKATDPNVVVSKKEIDEAIAAYESNFEPPNFTIKELRAAVPAHCFVRSTLRSFAYTAHDLILVSILVYLATKIDRSPLALQIAAWPLYWIAQSIVCFGIWILGHECGHRAYSPSTTVNDVVGWLLHSFLLVPFHSWRISHSTHHKSTGHIERDQPFIPRTRGEVGLSLDEIIEDAPLYRFARLVLVFVFGFPSYLLINLGGPRDTKLQSHYVPTAKLFEPSQRHQIVISDLGILATLGCLGYFSYVFSVWTVVKFYAIPYLMVNGWLVLVTYLQHTDPFIPHYRDGQWNFVRGALCTVDRDFGILNYFFHHITDTHVAHHLFSQMPFYHAQEATEAIKKILGSYYMIDRQHWLWSLLRSDKNCVFVEDTGEVLFYRGWKSLKHSDKSG